MQLLENAGPRLSINEVRSLEDTVALSLWELKWQATLLGSLGLLAVVLAAFGLYGVTQRTREIGIRMALGAQPGAIQQMVIGSGLRAAAVGIAAALLLSACSVRLLRDYLYGLSPFDPIRVRSGQPCVVGDRRPGMLAPSATRHPRRSPESVAARVIAGGKYQHTLTSILQASQHNRPGFFPITAVKR